jgi:hypothetical protein
LHRSGKKNLLKCKFLRDQWPSTGDACPALRAEGKEYVCLFGDAFCCPEGCEPAYRCDCIKGTFQCDKNKNQNPCPPVCPVQKPLDGTVCTLSDTTRCSYIDTKDASSNCTKVTDICQCENGVFHCLINYIGLDACVPKTKATVASPSLQYICPSSPVDVLNWATCTLAPYEVCGFEIDSCPGRNEGNGVFSVISFPRYACACKNGKLDCINSTSTSLATLGCHQAKPDFTTFPSVTPLA